ncbi:dynein axonemal assembly factor 3 homolog [Aedes albopictus]|uniref:Dynein assembly factor 3 C-terminal domain-containing protein n=1 Tax=Aedes albopictus TaxID=7160 RepID=A0ABM1Y496_AEDAL|nr:dynein assembly factor 3, axonemal homolog [Aedes albopictus]
MFWGFSEALDLFEEYRKSQDQTAEPPSELNILLFGLGDPRHVLKSASKTFKHSTKLSFVLLEGCLELVARNLLLTCIAFESGQHLSVKGKTHLFMDVFGNTLLRPFSNGYINAKAKVLTNVVTDADYAERVAPIFLLDGLRYRERDHLENVFNFWINHEKHVFNVSHYWDARVRAMLGTRYDHKMGAFDWDLYMRLRENGASQICPQEYKHWRSTGIAFTFPEYEQSDPNKTFAVGLARNGDGYMHRGVVGDVSTGPYGPFGLKCAEEKLTHSMHGVNDFRSTDVMERNVLEIMYEIQERKGFALNVKDIHQYGSYVLEQGQNLNKDQIRIESIESCKYDEPLIPCDSVKMRFLSVEDLLKIQSLPEHSNKYDIVVIASNYFSFLKEDFPQLFARNALICFETRQLTTFSKDDISQFSAQVRDYARTHSLKPLTNFAINVPHSILRYKNISQTQ